MRFGFIISLIFAILVALFGIQNSTIISINFFSTKFSISLALIIFISVIIGAIIVTLLSLQKEFTLSRGNKQLTKKAKDFETELETSKNDNVALTIENETFKGKTEALETKTQDLETKVEDLETKNTTLNNEITTLSIENSKLNTLSTNETSILK